MPFPVCNVMLNIHCKFKDIEFGKFTHKLGPLLVLYEQRSKKILISCEHMSQQQFVGYCEQFYTI